MNDGYFTSYERSRSTKIRSRKESAVTLTISDKGQINYADEYHATLS